MVIVIGTVKIEVTIAVTTAVTITMTVTIAVAFTIGVAFTVRFRPHRVAPSPPLVPTHLPFRVFVGAFFYQQLNHRQVSILGGHEKGRGTVLYESGAQRPRVKNTRGQTVGVLGLVMGLVMAMAGGYGCGWVRESVR